MKHLVNALVCGHHNVVGLYCGKGTHHILAWQTVITVLHDGYVGKHSLVGLEHYLDRFLENFGCKLYSHGLCADVAYYKLIVAVAEVCLNGELSVKVRVCTSRNLFIVHYRNACCG